VSLSKEILEGTREGVDRLLAQGAQVNVIDEYGYTPLIHATVLNKADIVAKLLKLNAMPNIADTTGATALLWAVDNSNVEICKMLLQAGANPNVYNASGQPALFYPLVRKNRELTQLLLDKGAKIDFATDFAKAKLVGHRFELQGRSDIINAEGLFISIDLEGFYLELTVNIILESLERFIHSYVAHRMDLHERELGIITKAFQRAAKLREYKHFSVNWKDHENTINDLLNHDLLLLPVSYKGHAITFVKYGNFLAKCDRGVQKMTDPIVIYSVGKPERLNNAFYTHLLYDKHTERYIKRELIDILGLKPYASLPIKHQITGNCSWANAEASVPTMLYMLLHQRLKDKSKADALVGEIMKFYRAWLEWDKDRAIEDWLEDFNKISFQRQKAKAALIGAVLFQACQPNRPQDVERAKRILKILSQKEFHYIVRTYANVFVRGRNSPEGLAFKRLIELCGYQLSEFNN
jgi:hypothetical protein